MSSARVVRCWVKSRNERNPCSLVAIIKLGTLTGLPGITRRKVGMTSNHHAPYVLGYTRATMAGTKRRRDREVERISKADPSSDCRLQLACMKSELLVIANQNARGECVPGSCTHRPSHHGSWGRPKLAGK